jgi:Domain of unknown function (DUF5916)
VRAHYADRDALTMLDNDDTVGIFIDPVQDGRRGFSFLANALGVQSDLLVDDVAGGEDISWDAIWASAGKRTSQGFDVEMAIPFSQLKLSNRPGLQTWTFDAFRFQPRDMFRRYSYSPLARGRNCNICQFLPVRGFDGVRSGKNLQITPTFTMSLTDDPNARRGTVPVDVDPQIGITGRWNITPTLSLNGMYNPDFSQVESDAIQLKANRQFALYYPERRPFFLEGADFFQTPFNVIYSRQIADPDWGVKLAGKIDGGYAIGALIAKDSITNILVPGPESSNPISLDSPSSSAVLRWRFDIGQNSTFGVLMSGRTGKDYFNSVLGADGSFRFRENHTIRFQIAESHARYPKEIDIGPRSGRPDLVGHAGFLEYQYKGANWRVLASHEEIGKEFRADLGFMPQVDIRRTNARVSRIFWGDEGGKYTLMSVTAAPRLTTRQDGTLVEGMMRVAGSFQGKLQSSITLGAEAGRRRFGGKEFNQMVSDLDVRLAPTDAVAVGLTGTFGTGIDYVGVRPGVLANASPYLNLRLGNHVDLQLAEALETFRLDAGRLYTASATRARLTLFLNARAFLRLYSQYYHLDNDVDLYGGALPELSRSFVNQILLSYKLNPQTLGFLGYSDAWDSDGSGNMQQSNWALFTKLSYAWLL